MDRVAESTNRYLNRIAEDCSTVLGNGVVMLAVEEERRDDHVRLIARYRLADREWKSTASGETVLVAHAALRARLVEDRLRLGFASLVDR